MKAIRSGSRFVLDMDLVELLTLYCVVEEERISGSLASYKFENPKKIKKMLGEFHAKFHNLLDQRTNEEMSVKFFKA